MNVIRAKTAGFCMGVDLALRTLDKAIRRARAGASPVNRICTLGPIIHNPQVLSGYEAQGVVCLDDFSTAKAGDVIVIRAHGVPRQTEEALRETGAKIVDATCPRVKKAQLSIAKATADGSTLLLFGEADHPEVRGLVSYASGRHHVFGDFESLKAIDPDSGESWVLASQTTQNAALFAEIRVFLEERLPRFRVLSTICDATDERQDEALAIAGQVEAMVVVGGKSSGNTRRLASLAAERGIASWHVEDVHELDPTHFVDKKVVGLTAGASTPKRLIDEAEVWLTRLPVSSTDNGTDSGTAGHNRKEEETGSS